MLMAEVVNTRSAKCKKVTIQEYELRVVQPSGRIKGKHHNGILIARVTNGKGIPAWMKRACNRINNERVETILTAQLIASIEREAK